jgi:hypothetical protein
VGKVRFVASTLLDALATPPNQNVETLSDEAQRASQRNSRAQNYLCESPLICSVLYRRKEKGDGCMLMFQGTF